MQFIGKAEDESGDAKESNSNYPDEEPWNREYFVEQLAKRGLKSDMPDEAFQDPDYVFKVASTSSQ